MGGRGGGVNHVLQTSLATELTHGGISGSLPVSFRIASLVELKSL